MHNHIATEQDIFIAAHEVIEGDIEAENIRVAGKVLGNLIARQQIEILASGTVLGDVRAKKVLVADGAHFKGNVDFSDDAQAHLELRCLEDDIVVGTAGNAFLVALTKGMPLPVAYTAIYTTAFDNQQSFMIHLAAGASTQRREVGYFNVTDIRPAPKGIPQIEITISVALDGCIVASARDLPSSESQKMAFGSARFSIVSSESPEPSESAVDETSYDIMMPLSVTPEELEREAVVFVDAPSGKQVSVKLPQMGREGMKLRLPKYGRDGKGDLYLQLHLA